MDAPLSKILNTPLHGLLMRMALYKSLITSKSQKRTRVHYRGCCGARWADRK